MQTTPETAALLDELYQRASIVTELDGPQLEAWVSGLFPVFDEHVTAAAFVQHCSAAATEQGALLAAAIIELTTGLDPQVPSVDGFASDLLPAWAATIGQSELTGAWSVTAPFGQSVVLGFDTPTGDVARPETDTADDADEAVDLRHSILVELDGPETLVDLQLTGPAKLLLDEVAASDDRVVVAEMSIEQAIDAVVQAWPATDASTMPFGPGFDANQQFVRRRVLVASGQVLPAVQVVEAAVDVRRGMSDDEFLRANQATLSTLQAAVGQPEPVADTSEGDHMVATWAGVVRGDIAGISVREREALLWLEWADWLGAGIGLLRAGAGTPADGAVLVDHVNRCPEVSSSIDKADRDYAEWAFNVALDLLQDQGAVSEERLLTDAGHLSLAHGLVRAWG